jgi:hypothetical protein
MGHIFVDEEAYGTSDGVIDSAAGGGGRLRSVGVGLRDMVVRLGDGSNTWRWRF